MQIAHIHLPSEGKGEEYFLDIRSHRTHRYWITTEKSSWRQESSARFRCGIAIAIGVSLLIPRRTRKPILDE